jgi:hypothetical protein
MRHQNVIFSSFSTYCDLDPRFLLLTSFSNILRLVFVFSVVTMYALKMEAVCFFEILVPTYKSTLRHNAEQEQAVRTSDFTFSFFVLLT